MQTLVKLMQGSVLFNSRATRVDLLIEGGFTCDSAYFDGIEIDKSKEFNLSFQNEYLLSQIGNRLLCSTPDLIILLDKETGIPILAERLRYGARLIALGVPANQNCAHRLGLKSRDQSILTTMLTSPQLKN